MLSALRLAAKSGVDIRIITPHRWDKWWVHMTTRSYYRELIKSGVKIYEYLKTIPLDDFRVKHDFTFIWPKDTVFSEEIRAICEEIQPITHSAFFAQLDNLITLHQ